MEGVKDKFIIIVIFAAVVIFTLSIIGFYSEQEELFFVIILSIIFWVIAIIGIIGCIYYQKMDKNAKIICIILLIIFIIIVFVCFMYKFMMIKNSNPPASGHTSVLDTNIDDSPHEKNDYSKIEYETNSLEEDKYEEYTVPKIDENLGYTIEATVGDYILKSQKTNSKHISEIKDNSTVILSLKDGDKDIPEAILAFSVDNGKTFMNKGDDIITGGIEVNFSTKNGITPDRPYRIIVTAYMDNILIASETYIYFIPSGQPIPQPNIVVYLNGNIIEPDIVTPLVSYDEITIEATHDACIGILGYKLGNSDWVIREYAPAILNMFTAVEGFTFGKLSKGDFSLFIAATSNVVVGTPVIEYKFTIKEE